MPEIPLTITQIRNGLHSGFSLDETDQFTFSIPNDVNSTWETDASNYTTDTSNPLNDFQPYDAAFAVLNSDQADNFREAGGLWDDLIAPDFTEVADNAAGHGEVRVAFTSNQMDPGTAGYAFQGANQTPTSIVGDVWLNAASVGDTFDVGTSDFETLLHEIGHVLGLKHPFEGTTIPDPYDDTRFTIMSYTSPYVMVMTPTGGGYSISIGPVVALTPSVLDIAAVQDLYGADPDTATGDDTYTFNQLDTVFSSIYDAGGTDTIDLTGVTRDSVIDLTPGSTSSVGGPWTEAEQIAYYAAITGDSEANIASFFNDPNNDPDPGNPWYDWTHNLGIAFTTTIENLIAGSGNDTITGNDVGNLISLHLGGDDTVGGGGGDDGFYFGAEFTGADGVDGGAGTLDQVGLQGDYSGGLTFGANGFVGVEMLVLLPGNDMRFGDPGTNAYSYDLTTVDANVDSGETFRVSFNTLRIGENVTFDGSAETNGAFLTFGGFGSDDLTGGAGDDGFYFGAGRFGTLDVLDGGVGTMDQLGLQGDYTGVNAVVFSPGQLTGLEMIVCLTAADERFNGNGAALYSYDITMNINNVAPGDLLMISANTLIAGESLSFDASADINGGRFTVWSGAGDDSLTGGSDDDTLYGAGGTDTLTGGGGDDVFGYSSAADSTTADEDTITDLTLGDQIDLSAIDAVAGGGDNAFSFIGSAAFSNTAGELRAVSLGGANWRVQGDTNGDGTADFSLLVTVFDLHTITAGDFVL